MIDQSPLPSRNLQLFARLARWILGLVVAFWLLVFGVWGALHGFIVPRIGEWRAEVEGMATKALGVSVRIGAVEGKTNGLFPSIHLRDVKIFDRQNREALHLPQVVATISARSVLRKGLEQLSIDAPELDVRHLADGRWQVAGLDLVGNNNAQSPGLHWLLEQPEIMLRKGLLRFTDEQRGMATVSLHDVDMVLRNRHWSHAVRLEASPAQQDGERLQLVGTFRESLLPSTQAPWMGWSGQWYAHMHLHRLPALPWPAAWGIDSVHGSGLARVWVDVEYGQNTAVTLDVAQAQAQVQWRDTALAALDVRQVQGRLQAQRSEANWLLQGQNFGFQLNDGSLWQPGNWAVHASLREKHEHSVSLQLDYANLRMAQKVLEALPAPQIVKQPLERWAPQGEIRHLDLQWKTDGSYHAKGMVTSLVMAPQPATQGSGIPGLQGLDAQFELNERGGQATLAMQDGMLHFPGVFEEAALPLHQLQAQVQWSVEQGRLKVEVPQAMFANEDAQGEFHGWWQMGENTAQRLPGHLHLQGRLREANGARVHRYLPLQVPETARQYVRNSVQQGVGENVEFEVKGPLDAMPFDQPGSGRFYIKAPVKQVTYAFVPPSLKGDAHTQWPTLTNLNGTLVFEGSRMTVQKAQSGFLEHPRLHMSSIAADIADLNHPVVKVQASGRTEMAVLLDLVRNSSLAEYTGHALEQAKAKGPAELAFELELPIAKMAQSKVRGQVGFQKTALQFNAQTPWLSQLQGAVQFNEQGFGLHAVEGQALGGSFKLSGGMPSVKQSVQIQAQGTATASGLQKEDSMPVLQQLGSQATGAAAYSVHVEARKGEQQVTVRSDLQGMALRLPQPFDKPQEAAWPLTVQQVQGEAQEQTLTVRIPERLDVRYEETGTQGQADVRGHIVIGAVSGPARSAPGILAKVQLENLNADAWIALLSARDTPWTASKNTDAYLPSRIELDIKRLMLRERDLHDVQAAFSVSQGIWRGQLQAQQFAGYAQYSPPATSGEAGKVFVRLSHLSIPETEAKRLNDWPEETAAENPETLPALDIEVEQLAIAGKALGKLELRAHNTLGQSGRAWSLERFNLTLPEARWQANGSWRALTPGGPRVTHLDFLLEMDSSGKLLERFGMPGVIRDGKGQLSGHIAWRGAPITPDWHSMDGGIHMQVEQGQFLKAEPGIGKLLSVLSLQSLARRIQLDFRDVFSQGFAFDFIRGDIGVEQGVARTNNLQMKGLNAAVLMEGKASLVNETQDLKVVVVPEINAMTASLAATAINPVLGLGSFLAQMFLRGPLMEAATRTFHVHGTWADPVVEPVPSQKTN